MLSPIRRRRHSIQQQIILKLNSIHSNKHWNLCNTFDKDQRWRHFFRTFRNLPSGHLLMNLFTRRDRTQNTAIGTRKLDLVRSDVCSRCRWWWVFIFTVIMSWSRNDGLWVWVVIIKLCNVDRISWTGGFCTPFVLFDVQEQRVSSFCISKRIIVFSFNFSGNYL